MTSFWSAITQVVGSCLPMFIIIFLGWLCAKKGIFNQDSKKLLSGLVSNFVFPALLFTATAHADPAKIFDGVWIIAFFCTLLVIWALCFIVNRYFLHYDAQQATMQSLFCGFTDMGGMGLPFLSLMFGVASSLSVAIANFVVGITLLPLTIIFLNIIKAKSQGREIGIRVIFEALKMSLMKPLFLGVILGMIVSVTGSIKWLPSFVFDTTNIVSNACNFISLLAVGVGIYGVKLTVDRPLVVNVILKCLVAPAIAIAATILFGIKGQSAQELVFLIAMPTATTAVVLAYSWKIQQNEAASIFLASTVLSVIMLPTLLLIMRFFLPQ